MNVPILAFLRDVRAALRPTSVIASRVQHQMSQEFPGECPKVAVVKDDGRSLILVEGPVLSTTNTSLWATRQHHWLAKYGFDIPGEPFNGTMSQAISHHQT